MMKKKAKAKPAKTGADALDKLIGAHESQASAAMKAQNFEAAAKHYAAARVLLDKKIAKLERQVEAARKIRQPKATKNPSPGEMLYGEHASAAQRKAAATSRKKALAWFRRSDLVDEPQTCTWEPPVSFIDVGNIEALEYTSTKFDDKNRLYRHEVTQKRKLLLSTDGSCLLIFPPFRVTTRGIEG